MAHEYDEVPLDRDEETTDPASGALRLATRDQSISVLFHTTIAELKPKPPVTVSVAATVAEACARMREHRIGCVLVMDGEELVGIFTERDVLYKVTSSDRPLGAIGIDELMSRNPTTLGCEQSLAFALNKMSVDGCRHVPVVDGLGRAVGVVSVRRIVDYLVDRFPEQLLTLPPEADRLVASREGG